MAESGYPEVEGSSWTGVFVPTGTPKEIIAQLNRLVVGIVALPDIKDKLAALGIEPIGTSVEDSNAFVRGEMAKWSKVIQAAGIKAE